MVLFGILFIIITMFWANEYLITTYLSLPDLARFRNQQSRFLGVIVEGLSPSPDRDDTGEIFMDRLLVW